MAKSTKRASAVERRKAPLRTPTDLGSNARRDIGGALNAILADTYALYVKTKNFHWHVSGPHFRDYHLMFDEQAAELRDDNKDLTQRLREVHDLCDEHDDVASASMIENWIDEAERRTWFLFETTRQR
jgi:starvation-inducible DNA-binding protein